LNKKYIAGIKLGVVTDTRDLSGRVLFTRRVRGLSYKKVLMSLDKFKGEIEQVPPAYSSVKYRGRPSYVYARKGQNIDLKPKKVNIYNLELISLEGSMLTIKVECGSGTYVRSLAYDIGDELGVGASVKSLKRITVGDYKLEDSINIDGLLKEGISESCLDSSSYIISIERMLEGNKSICISDEFKSQISSGSPVKIRMLGKQEIKEFGSFKKGTFVKIIDSKENLLAVHRILSDELSVDIGGKDLKLTESILIL